MVYYHPPRPCWVGRLDRGVHLSGSIPGPVHALSGWSYRATARGSGLGLQRTGQPLLPVCGRAPPLSMFPRCARHAAEARCLARFGASVSLGRSGHRSGRAPEQPGARPARLATPPAMQGRAYRSPESPGDFYSSEAERRVRAPSLLQASLQMGSPVPK